MHRKNLYIANMLDVLYVTEKYLEISKLITQDVNKKNIVQIRVWVANNSKRS
jgi:hypothetical protein